MNYQQVQYKLINRDNGTSVVLSKKPQTAADSLYPAPKNWDNYEPTLKRAKEFGAFVELSKDLVFTKGGAQFLRQAYLVKDTEADVVMEEYRTNPQTEELYLHSTGTFDFSEYTYENKTVSIPFKTGGLYSLIKSKLNEKVQLERTEAINGAILDPLEYVTLALTRRQIFLISVWETEENRTISTTGIGGVGSISGAFVPNLTVVSNSDQENVQPTFDDNEQFWDGGSETTVTETQLFYNDSDVAKTITLYLDYKIRCGKGGMATTAYEVKLYRYNYDGSTYNYVDATLLQDLDYQDKTLWVEYNDSVELTLEAGDSLRLGFLTQAGSGTITSAYINFEIDHIDLRLEEDSTREPSNTKALLYHEVGDRLMQIITGEQGRFYSEFYGRTDIGYSATGEYAITAVALGLWLRKFDDEKIETNLKEYLETSNAVHATTWGIDINGADERLIVEDIGYFFQNAVTITLPNQVSNLKRTAAPEHTFTSLVFGYKNPNADTNNSLYDEAMGLDEYNTKANHTTPISKTTTTYEKVAPMRADCYGKEFAARKPKINYPEEDTKYDREKFIFDCKLGDGEAIIERTWADDYEELPTGVYSPETATNLRLAPREMFGRHEWLFSAGLYKHTDSKVYFGSKIGNELLTTKKSGEDYVSENDNVPINELAFNRFANQWIEFEHPVDFDINAQVYGRTTIGGRSVPNYYGKVRFINDEGEFEEGYIFQLNPEKEGKWKLLKAR